MKTVCKLFIQHIYSWFIAVDNAVQNFSSWFSNVDNVVKDNTLTKEVVDKLLEEWTPQPLVTYPPGPLHPALNTQTITSKVLRLIAK